MREAGLKFGCSCCITTNLYRAHTHTQIMVLLQVQKTSA